MGMCGRQYCALMHVSQNGIVVMWLTRQQDLRAGFSLKAGDDEKADANSHDIFKRGNHQVGNFKGFH